MNFLRLTARFASTMETASRIPGITAARNSSGTDTLMVEPYTIMQMLGGMMGPRAPAAASMPPVSPRE